MLTAWESGKAQESGLWSAQSTGMQEGAGKYGKPTGNCKNPLFIGQGESRHISACNAIWWAEREPVPQWQRRRHVHCNATAGVIVRRAFESEFFVE